MFKIEKFAQRLRELRKELGESQQTVAQLLGTSVTQICDMERGKTTTSFERLVLLCEHYKASAYYPGAERREVKKRREIYEDHR